MSEVVSAENRTPVAKPAENPLNFNFVLFLSLARVRSVARVLEK
jgi:hypothetical protein